MPDLRALGAAAALRAVAVSTASAAPLFASSYDTRNGNGQAGGGSFNCWALAHAGTGPTAADGRILIRDDFDVPEPSTIALLGAAWAGLALRRRGRPATSQHSLQTIY